MCPARIVALRAGHIVYDGPAADFTDAQVAALYGSRAALEDVAPEPATPAAMPGERAAVPLICR
jgi:ABC-type phosphate/phosphonate transport system ATPase subunit